MALDMFASLVGLLLVMGVLIFVAAGTGDYWQAWLFLVCYFAASVVVSLWLMRHDPALLRRRMRGGPFAEQEPRQKIIMTITSIGFVALPVVPGLDRRFGWSGMQGAIAILGDLLLLAGWLGILAVFRANSFAAATIQVASDQKVVSTGPYAVVRHPMYATALLMLLGIPVSLGSAGHARLGRLASRSRVAPPRRGARAAARFRRLRRLSPEGQLEAPPLHLVSPSPVCPPRTCQ
jgi:protein-S-isoprenylcysteine O-methyltransferase Ste14